MGKEKLDAFWKEVLLEKFWQEVLKQNKKISKEASNRKLVSVYRYIPYLRERALQELCEQNPPDAYLHCLYEFAEPLKPSGEKDEKYSLFLKSELRKIHLEILKELKETESPV